NTAADAGIHTPCQGPAGATVTDSANYCGVVVSSGLSLGVSISRSGPFYRSQATAVYTVTFNTQQPVATSPYTLTLSLPANFRLTSLPGVSWNCDVPSATCRCLGWLPPNTNLPPVTVAGSVDAQSGSFTASATLASPSGTTNTASDTVNMLPPDVNLG